jgi:hypothetical protein
LQLKGSVKKSGMNNQEKPYNPRNELGVPERDISSLSIAK